MPEACLSRHVGPAMFGKFCGAWVGSSCKFCAGCGKETANTTLVEGKSNIKRVTLRQTAGMRHAPLVIRGRASYRYFVVIHEWFVI